MEPACYFTYANPQDDLLFLEHEEKAIDHIFAQRIKGGEGETARMWNLNGKIITNFDTYESVFAVTFSPYSKYVLLGGRNNTTILDLTGEKSTL